MNTLILGAVAMASCIASLFFLRFWFRTGDLLFLLFALAFAVDAAMRVALGLDLVGSEMEPVVYLGRLITFSLIIGAIVYKNRR